MEEKKIKIFGIRALIEAIEAGKTIEKVYIRKGISNILSKELNILLKKNFIPISYVPVEKLDKMSKLNNHQGVVGSVCEIEFKDLEQVISKIPKEKKALFIVLDQITDVRNFGAIVRTAKCTGVDGVIISQSASAPMNAQAIKTSAGAAFSVPICKVSHIKDALFILQANSIEIVAATEKTEDLVYGVNLNKHLAIVMGSEYKGISQGVLKFVDKKARLPLLGGIGSLNVSVACGVFLYEVIRQRNYS